MEEARDYAPIWLSGITVVALCASVVAVMHGEPRTVVAPRVTATARPSTAPWPTANGLSVESRVASRPHDCRFATDSPQANCLPAVSAIDESDLSRDVERLLGVRTDADDNVAFDGQYVRRFPVGPLAAGPCSAIGAPRWLAPQASNPGELFVLVPGEPNWRAGGGRVAVMMRDLRLSEREFSRLAFVVGRWWATARSSTFSLPSWWATVRVSDVAPRADFASPASLLDPVRVGAGDRLAMTPRRPNLTKPALQLRDRETPRVVAMDLEATDHRRPTELLQLLAVLAASPETAAWAGEVQTTVLAAQADTTGAANRALDKLSMRGLALADTLDDMRLAITLRRACYAINRRAETWRILGQLESREATVLTRAPDADQRLRRRLESVLSVTHAGGQQVAVRSDAWRRYLLTDQIESALRGETQPVSRAQLAADILRRMAPSVLSPDQQRFIAIGPIAALGDELQAWGGPPTDTLQLAGNLETYETTRSPHLAQVIARDVRRLNNSSTNLHRELAGEIEKKYRNANLRVAVSDALLGRFVPAAPVRIEPVRQQIAGALVRGQSRTEANLSLRLLPDPFGWRLGLEARGTTHSRTHSNPGPVMLRNQSSTDFIARKLITVDFTGLNTAPAVCSARSQTRLVGLASDYDSVPLLGRVIRSQAHDRYEEQLPVAKRQAENRIADRVSASLDLEAEPALAKLQQRYVTEVLDRTSVLGLDVEPLELRTTESRLIARLRVANQKQLAAHTPRNRAPSDSAASIQVHESLINNTVESLGLTGRRWTPDELQAFICARLNLPKQAATPTDEPLEIVFDEKEPLRVKFDGGQAELVLGVREMTFGKSRFQRFKVHAFYEPQADGIEAQMVRVGGVQIEGRMRAGSRLKLHGVFTQVLDESKPLPLLQLPSQGEPRLDGLMVTQLVIGDGWLGLAIGPQQNGGRVATVGRYLR